MPVQQPIPIKKILDALLDEHTPFRPRYLIRLSDLEPDEASQLDQIWPKVSLKRRRALLEDMEELHMADDLQNFDAVARIALGDSEPAVRILAISILREYELVDLLPKFIDMAEHDPHPDVRAAATAALATYIYMGEVEEISPSRLHRVEECLLKLVSSQDSVLVRRRALEALGFSSRDEVVGLIENAYSSGDMDWIISALFSMGRSANSQWNSQVMEMLNHTHPGVRAEAASAAGELEMNEAKAALLDLLDDSDFDVRMAAIWALSQIGGTGVREALENQLESTDDYEEADQIDNALENLEFTEEMREINLMEISEIDEHDDDSSDDEYYENIDDLISEDDRD